MKFSSSHEWVELNDNIATVGITNYGRMHLGDVINITLPEIGKEVKASDAICVLESNKAAVDSHSPMSGKVTQINEELKTNLDKLNKAPETEGWLFKLQVSDPKELDQLMNLEEYEKKVSK